MQKTETLKLPTLYNFVVIQYECKLCTYVHPHTHAHARPNTMLRVINVQLQQN